MDAHRREKAESVCNSRHLGKVVGTAWTGVSEQLPVKEIRREEVMQRFHHYPGFFLKKICVKGNRDVGETDQLGGSA